ncbi:hypothetical protein NDU88_001163 [Pleurodeles waltl]|uniref:Uncharacterized protein n=1 Tax=Pleurodeles waltl TaxID=8319 RepID=A0AAV7TH12_PLEWA|nr:hypothetical protein NDU88_001163 [Pleurodeles waltl]
MVVLSPAPASGGALKSPLGPILILAPVGAPSLERGVMPVGTGMSALVRCVHCSLCWWVRRPDGLDRVTEVRGGADLGYPHRSQQ